MISTGQGTESREDEGFSTFENHCSTNLKSIRLMFYLNDDTENNKTPSTTGQLTQSGDPFDQ